MRISGKVFMVLPFLALAFVFIPHAFAATPVVTIDKTTVQLAAGEVTVSGTAKNVSSVVVALTNATGPIYTSNPTSVINGHWSVIISTSPGVYTIKVSANRKVLLTKTLTILPPPLSVTVVAPNGGPLAYFNFGENVGLSWQAESIPAGSSACTTFIRESDGATFAWPPLGETPSCTPALDGNNYFMHTGKVASSTTSNLTPGAYRFRISIVSSGGTTLVSDMSDQTFDLRIASTTP